MHTPQLETNSISLFPQSSVVSLHKGLLPHISVLMCSALAHRAAHSSADLPCVATASSKRALSALWISLQALRLHII